MHYFLNIFLGAKGLQRCGGALMGSSSAMSNSEKLRVIFVLNCCSRKALLCAVNTR